MRILSIVGARPQFVKLAPVASEMRDRGHEHFIVHTGQHYDPKMSDIFFEDLGIPQPNIHLGVGSDTHGRQTGAILGAMDDVLRSERPDCVLVYGDTNSTLAGALSAVKLHFALAHLEAGLRSFNRRMPEEHNRVLTDHAADLCLAPTELAMTNLITEGLGKRSVLVGDVMTDVCLAQAKATRVSPLAGAGEFVLASIHRAENTDDPDRLRGVIRALMRMNRRVVLPAHPRLMAKSAEHGISLSGGNLEIIDPLDYPGMVSAVQSADAVVTDSGGLQKEAFLLRTPCVTVRTETEWRETVELGWNVLTPDPQAIEAALSGLDPQPTDAAPYGDGYAADATVEALEKHVSERD